MVSFSRIILYYKTVISSRIPWKWVLVLFAIGLSAYWLLNTPAGLLGKADAVGYAVCHRIDARSFHLGERILPMCARCTGQYLGAMLGIVYQLAMGRRRTGRPPWGVIVGLGLFVLAYAVDGLNSYIHLMPFLSRYYLYEPNNTLRLLTGTGLGLTISAGLLPAFHQTVWTRWDRRPALGGIKSLSGLVVLALLVDIAVLTENPLILYPMALISAAGVLVLLTMVYTMVWLMVLKAENRYESLKQMPIPLTAGFVLALLQIGTLDLVRYFFTGTWGGFHLG
jgi:uncharacterized membrane protein